MPQRTNQGSYSQLFGGRTTAHPTPAPQMEYNPPAPAAAGHAVGEAPKTISDILRSCGYAMTLFLSFIISANMMHNLKCSQYGIPAYVCDVLLGSG